MSLGFQAAVARDWESRRCEPGVVVTAGWFKPSSDLRTSAEFARDNWSFCQKQYVQSALRTAAEAPAAAVAVQADIGKTLSGIVGSSADVFYGVWRFIHSVYAGFQEQMAGAAKLFRNFLLRMNDVVERLQASVLSVVYGLIALVAAFVSSVQVILIVAIIIIGILLALMVILFFLLMPISSLILTMTAVVSVMVIAVSTAIAAAMVSELFTPGACFDTGTRVEAADGTVLPIEKVAIGQILRGGGIVTATHRFETLDRAYRHDGIAVTGDHLVHREQSDERVFVRNDGRFKPDVGLAVSREVWCLTTTNRQIPVRGDSGKSILFADWEEISDIDVSAKREWFREVWNTLNPGIPLVIPAMPIARALNSDAGLSPDVEISVPAGMLGVHLWSATRRACDLNIGDLVLDADNKPTRIVGVTRMEGSLNRDALVLPGGRDALVTIGCWVQPPEGGAWSPPGSAMPRDIHPARWIHFYTTSGTLLLANGWKVRDASDVGLARIGGLVTSVVPFSTKC